MKRLAAGAALAAVLVLVGAGAIVPALSSAEPVVGKISLTGVVVESHQFGVGAGSRATWRFSLASVRRPGKPFGYMVLVCTRVSTETTLRQCNGTASLPRGKIALNGAFLYLQAFQLAATGGTDDYAGVKGSARAVQLTPHPAVYDVTITLV